MKFNGFVLVVVLTILLMVPSFGFAAARDNQGYDDDTLLCLLPSTVLNTDPILIAAMGECLDENDDNEEDEIDPEYQEYLKYLLYITFLIPG